MMKKIFKMGVLAAALLCVSTAVQAQKFGYINSAEILAGMPKVKQMQSNLESFGKQLQKKGQQMVAEYQTKEQEAIQKEERGEVSPMQKQTLLQELQTKQQEILQYEQEMQQKIAQKEQELLEPILEEVNNAIKAVASENKYTYIFDAGSGAILYADESTNVSSLVKAKLGI